MQPLFGRKIGKTLLAVYPVERSTLLNGSAPARGTETTYAVRAGANLSSRPEGRELGAFETLEQAIRFCQSFERGYLLGA